MRISRGLFIAGAATLLHAGLTYLMFMLYVKTAMATSHDALAKSFITISQHVKAIFLWPILLPLLRSRPDLLSGWLAIVFLLLNSLVWIVGAKWVYRTYRRWRVGD